MMDIYNGNIVTDGSGLAVVELPAYFESLNSEFRYQLTTIGSPAKAWIATEVANNRTIKNPELFGHKGEPSVIDVVHPRPVASKQQQ